MSGQTAAATWNAVLGQLELTVTRANFDTWLRDTVGLRHEPHAFVIGAPNDFAIEWLSARMKQLITKALAGVLGHAMDVTFECIRHEDEPPALLPDVDAAAIPDFLRKSPAVPPALNPALTFDTFVVGDDNRMAHDAAWKTATEPGAITPLVIFGTAGLGKTHLLNAIGHAAHAAGRAVIYAPAERFGNDYVRAIKDATIERFRARYRSCDVLLIDDVQFFEGKDKFQVEFFHAFNDLHAAGAQIVVSADRPPSQLALMDALRSRFQWGLAADLQRPSFETRLAILRAKASQHSTRLPDDALVMIAEKCCPTVRELEGYLNRVIAYIPLVRGEPTSDVIERALSPLQPSNRADGSHVIEGPCADDVIGAVCRRTGAQPADLRGRSRNRQVAYARHLAMFVLKEDARKSIAEIGRAFSNRDHSTVIAGVERIRMELATRPETADDLAAVREHLAAQREASVAAAG
ncbi:MAG: chromosomal replication initiator protein DnaA [Dehalococcoidia bacterium]